MTEPCDLSAIEARRRIGARQLSPMELLDSCVSRIATVNPTLNAIPTQDLDRARAAAVAAEAAVARGDPLGTLHGLPIGIKDLQDTAGLRTTYGSPIYANHVPEHDDRIVASVRAAGAIVVGKTNVPEWGAGANTRNPVLGVSGNPFDPSRTPGGSSGGSAAALATGMVPLATGSDTGGSLRNPAAFCGVVGFRPSQGVVPAETKGLGWSPISVLGPMGRTVGDAALLLSAIAGDDPREPFIGWTDPADFRSLPSVDLSTLRVAVSEDLGFAPVSSAVRETFRAKCGRFGQTFRSCEWRTSDFTGADEVFEVVRAATFLASFLDPYRAMPELLGPHVTANVEQGLTLSLENFAAAHQRETEIYRSLQALFDDVDLLICPAAAVAPFPSETPYPDTIDGRPTRTYFHWLAINYGLSLTTNPVVALPCGRDGGGLPFGIQIVGRRAGDRAVLAAAAALEAVFAADLELMRPIPDVAGLAQRA
jgi:Asp-tRNA(Asn)/Glu-tRNA(Gln) amidotransferase A subunit family amidase